MVVDVGKQINQWQWFTVGVNQRNIDNSYDFPNVSERNNEILIIELIKGFDLLFIAIKE